ncbi:hypothetical protein PMAC_002792 [Pneumocystis sp. 'macacae']|nr:hypothetical protein PMAC_002792 [Pneumocystis sp. 'macacae']
MRQEGRCARGSEISVCTKQQGGSVQSRGWGEEGGSDVKKMCTKEMRVCTKHRVWVYISKRGGRSGCARCTDKRGGVVVEIRTGGVKNKNNRTEEIEVELD